ncbi:MAG: hypothetical protein ACREWI_15860 [Telluria sp.]
MQMLFRLFGPRRRKNQEEIAHRAAEVIVHVLYDVGLERFLEGTVLLDRRFRLHFYAVPPQDSNGVLASVPVNELAEARLFDAHVQDRGIDAPTLDYHARQMAAGFMRELRARSPALRQLPAARRTRIGALFSS